MASYQKPLKCGPFSEWHSSQRDDGGTLTRPVRTLGSAAWAAAPPWQDSHCTPAVRTFLPSLTRLFGPVTWQPMHSFSCSPLLRRSSAVACLVFAHAS